MGKPRNHLQRMKTRYFDLVKEWQQAIKEGREADADNLERRMNDWWEAIKILDRVDLLNNNSDNNQNGK
jgi:hypothetical protein